MAKMSNTISLGEFQRLTRLTDDAMMWLLRNKKIPLLISNDEIQIEVKLLQERVIIDALLQAGKEEAHIEDQLVVERITSLLGDKIELAIEEAFALLAKSGKIHSS